MRHEHVPAPSAGGGREDGRAPDDSMNLLHDITYRPVAVPEAPGGTGLTGPSLRSLAPGRTVGTVLAAAALGLLTVAAITSLRAPQPAALQGRALLVDEITERSSTTETLVEENQRLAAEIAETQEATLRTSDPELVADLRRSEVASGAVAVAGPGLVVVLDDPDAPDGVELDAEERVQDGDVQQVANALWAAGAEAVAINGQRLTSVSAIRGAGEAIWVDLSPLLAPYRVEAVGDPRGLQTGFARSSASSHLSVLSGTYGIRTSVTTSDRLELPAAGSSVLRYAQAPDGAVPSDRQSEEGTS